MVIEIEIPDEFAQVVERFLDSPENSRLTGTENGEVRWHRSRKTLEDYIQADVEAKLHSWADRYGGLATVDMVKAQILELQQQMAEATAGKVKATRPGKGLNLVNSPETQETPETGNPSNPQNGKTK